MIRGTTPTLSFELPSEIAEVSELWITVLQNSTVMINKTLAECELNGNLLTVRLTQEETLKLQGDCTAKIQLRVRTASGDAMASEIMENHVYPILKGGVI